MSTSYTSFVRLVVLQTLCLRVPCCFTSKYVPSLFFLSQSPLLKAFHNFFILRTFSNCTFLFNFNLFYFVFSNLVLNTYELLLRIAPANSISIRRWLCSSSSWMVMIVLVINLSDTTRRDLVKTLQWVVDVNKCLQSTNEIYSRKEIKRFPL